MENLNEKLDILKQAFRDRIKAGQFHVVNVEIDDKPGYKGIIKVDVDGVEFMYSLSGDETYVADHGDIKLFPYGSDADYFVEMHRQFDLHESELKKEKIKQLKQKLEKLES